MIEHDDGVPVDGVPVDGVPESDGADNDNHDTGGDASAEERPADVTSEAPTDEETIDPDDFTFTEPDTVPDPRAYFRMAKARAVKMLDRVERLENASFLLVVSGIKQVGDEQFRLAEDAIVSDPTKARRLVYFAEKEMAEWFEDGWNRSLGTGLDDDDDDESG